MSGTVEAGKLLIQVEATTENLKRQLDAALAAVNSATSGMADSVKKVDTAFGGMGDAIEKALGFLGKLTGGFSPLASSMVGVVAAGTGVERMFEKIAESAIEYAKSIAEAGDEHVKLVAQLTAVTGSAESAIEAFDKLEALTLQTGVAVSQSADMFKRLTVAGKEVGLTTDEVQSLVAILEKAGVAAGASGAEIAAVTNSLTVGFLSGTVNARQFRSIITEMPTLATAIADSLGLSVEKLMDMAKHGKLTADVLQSGILGAGESIDKTFAKVPETMDRAWGELKGGMDQFGAALDNALGISKSIAAQWHDIAQTAAGWAKIINGPDALEKVANDLTVAKNAMKDVDDELDRRAKARSLKPDSLKPDSFTATVDPLARDQTFNVYAGKTDAQLAEDKAKLLKGVTDAQAAQYELLRHGALAEQAADQAAHATAEKNLDDHNAAILTKLQAGYDKRAAIRQKFDENSAQLDKMESQLVPGVDNTKAIADIEKARAGILKEEQDALDAVTKSEEAHNKKLDEAIKKANDVVASTQLQADKAKELYDVHNQGADAIEKVNIQAKINAELTRAGIPLIAGATDAWAKQRAEITNNVTTTVQYDDKLKNLTESQNQAKQAAEEYARQLAQTSKEIADQISTGFYDMLTNDKKGQSFLDYFKGLFKKLATQALTANIVLPIIAPIVSAGASFLGVGTSGGGQQLFNAAGQVIGTVGGGAGAAGTPAGASTSGGLMGSGSVLSNLLPVGSLANTVSGGSIFSSIGNSLGLTGPGGVFGSGGFLGSGGAVSTFLGSGIGGTSTAEAAASAASNAFAPAATGMFGGASVGSLLGGAGAGFGAGMLVNNLLGGKQVGGTVGSGVGAIGGTLIGAALTPILGPFGPLIGGLIGGAAGGGLGGLIGPGPKHQAFGINTQVQDNQIQVIRAIGSDQAGLKAALDDANQQIAQLNQIVNVAGLTVSTAGGYGTIGKGNAATQAATFAETIPTDYRFAGPAGSDVATALANSGGVVQSAQALTDLITFVTGSYAQLSKTSEKTNQYDDAVTALTATYSDAISKAQSYGLATDKLSSNLADGVAKIRQAQADAVTAATGSVNQALLTAQGRTYEAQTYGMGSGKQKQLDDLQSQLESLGLSAADAAPWVDKLSEAIDLQIQAVKVANSAQRLSVLQQSQIDAMNARGQTYQASVFKASIDSANAVNTLSDTLTALGQSADTSKPFIDDLTAAYRDQALAAEAAHQRSINSIIMGLQVDLTNALSAVDPTKKAAGDLAVLGVQQYQKFLDLGDALKSAGATAQETSDAFAYLAETQKLERDALAKTADATNSVTDALLNSGKSIQAYIDSLNQTGAGGASPVNQFAAAQQIFGDQLKLAGSGNADALANITSNATAFLDAAKAMYGASSAGYADAVSLVKKDLSGLPATTSYEAQVLAALKDLGGGIDVQVQLDVIRNIKETLNALPQSEKDKLQVAESILHTIEERMGRQLTGAEFEHLLEVQGLTADVIQTIDQILKNGGLTPDQLVAIGNIADLPPDATKNQNVTQVLNTTGDPAITADPITKEITQHVKTSEEIQIDISDTLTQIMNDNYQQLLAIGELIYGGNLQLVQIAANTGGGVAVAAAMGRVFSGGNVVPFRRGGVVNVPTYAPIALFGEAGPEAIMPLQRDSSGRLGVSAVGGGGGGTVGISVSGKSESEDVTAAFAALAGVLRDELRLLRGDVQDMRATLRRAVAA